MAELESSRSELENIHGSVADGIIARDSSGHLVYANDAAAAILGYGSAKTLLDTPVEEVMNGFEILDEEGKPLPFDDLPGRNATRGGHRAEAMLRLRDVATGEERWTEVVATPVVDARGEARFKVNIFHDVTERKRLEEALMEIREAEHRRMARDLHDSV